MRIPCKSAFTCECVQLLRHNRLHEIRHTHYRKKNPMSLIKFRNCILNSGYESGLIPGSIGQTRNKLSARLPNPEGYYMIYSSRVFSWWWPLMYWCLYTSAQCVTFGGTGNRVSLLGDHEPDLPAVSEWAVLLHTWYLLAAGLSQLLSAHPLTATESNWDVAC